VVVLVAVQAVTLDLEVLQQLVKVIQVELELQHHLMVVVVAVALALLE
jgi:hypothetical protein